MTFPRTFSFTDSDCNGISYSSGGDIFPTPLIGSVPGFHSTLDNSTEPPLCLILFVFFPQFSIFNIRYGADGPIICSINTNTSLVRSDYRDGVFFGTFTSQNITVSSRIPTDNITCERGGVYNIVRPSPVLQTNSAPTIITATPPISTYNITTNDSVINQSWKRWCYNST